MFHIEESDQFGNPITTSNTQSTPAACSKGNVAKEVDDEEEDEEEEEEEEEEGEDRHGTTTRRKAKSN